MATVPAIRIVDVNDKPLSTSGDYVLYWMIAARRSRYNFALQQSVSLANEQGVGLFILEPLRCDYEWASDRFHQFIIDGMVANAKAFKETKAYYYPYVEEAKGDGKGLLAALAKKACAVVTDDYPAFFLPEMIAAAGKAVPCKLQKVDGNGIYPLRATERVFTTAASFRRHLQKDVPNYFTDFPNVNPSRSITTKAPTISKSILKKWKPFSGKIALSKLPIDHHVCPCSIIGGETAAHKRLTSFLKKDLSDYPELRNQPEEDCQSGLSPYLHFGHISSHEIFKGLIKRDDWSPERIAPKATGSRAGWWGMSEAGEAFVDQLITWREIGFNMASKAKNYRSFASLPEWSKKSLSKHSEDTRESTYTLKQFENSQTHDELWNAAQNQLVRDGIIHNYLRMLWGKKILEWTRSPKEALKVMIHLNNKYALDGRDPNSYSGIFWTLGRYDRAWGPEREIFGKIRYMSSANTARKVKVKNYVEHFNSAETREESPHL